MISIIHNFCSKRIITSQKSKHNFILFRGFLSHLRRDQKSLKCFREGFNIRKFGNYKLVQPAQVSEKRRVPSNITTPSYYENTIPTPAPSNIEIKNEKQINGMRESCKLARQVLDTLQTKSVVKAGVTTDELDAFVHDLIISHGAYPSPLNYQGFPKSICTSVNNVVCHGIPDNRPLHDGDIVNVDITVFYRGFHGDCSAMFLIGKVDDKGKHLVRATLEALNAAVNICKPGEPFSSIGNTCEKIAQRNNLKIVPNYSGHGIGSYFHGPPDISHYANNKPGLMAAGMTFTIEPILAQGSPRMAILEDDWTSVTLDGSRSAQWEHTVLITPTGVELLTGPDYTLPE